MNVAVAWQHTSWSQSLHHLSTKIKLMDTTVSPSENWTLAGRVKWCVEIVKMKSIHCSRTGAGGDGKCGTPREERQNDRSGKKSLKDFTKEYSMKGGRRKAWECFCNRIRIICLQDLSAWVRKAHELVACSHAHTAQRVHPSKTWANLKNFGFQRFVIFWPSGSPFGGLFQIKMWTVGGRSLYMRRRSLYMRRMTQIAGPHVGAMCKKIIPNSIICILG